MDGIHNSTQGALLKVFYDSCGLKNGDSFAVVPIAIKGIRTAFVCGRRS